LPPAQLGKEEGKGAKKKGKEEGIDEA